MLILCVKIVKSWILNEIHECNCCHLEPLENKELSEITEVRSVYFSSLPSPRPCVKRYFSHVRSLIDARQKKQLQHVTHVIMFHTWFLSGEMAVLYLYMRYRYNWNEVTFSMFSTFAMITNLIGKKIAMSKYTKQKFNAKINMPLLFCRQFLPAILK